MIDNNKHWQGIYGAVNSVIDWITDVTTNGTIHGYDNEDLYHNAHTANHECGAAFVGYNGTIRIVIWYNQNTLGMKKNVSDIRAAFAWWSAIVFNRI